jgi:hypothetical protein
MRMLREYIDGLYQDAFEWDVEKENEIARGGEMRFDQWTSGGFGLGLTPTCVIKGFPLLVNWLPAVKKGQKERSRGFSLYLVLSM